MEDSQFTIDLDYHTISYDSNAQTGIEYLRDHLDSSERKAFFDEAKLNTKAEFEDASGRRYTLSHDSGTGQFQLLRHD